MQFNRILQTNALKCSGFGQEGGHTAERTVVLAVCFRLIVFVKAIMLAAIRVNFEFSPQLLMRRASRWTAHTALFVLPWIDSCKGMVGSFVSAVLLDRSAFVQWASVKNAEGITPNTVIDSNDEAPG